MMGSILHIRESPIPEVQGDIVVLCQTAVITIVPVDLERFGYLHAAGRAKLRCIGSTDTTSAFPARTALCQHVPEYILVILRCSALPPVAVMFWIVNSLRAKPAYGRAGRTPDMPCPYHAGRCLQVTSRPATPAHSDAVGAIPCTGLTTRALSGLSCTLPGHWVWKPAGHAQNGVEICLARLGQLTVRLVHDGYIRGQGTDCAVFRRSSI